MDDSLFYCGVEQTEQNESLINMLKTYSENRAVPIYVLDAPLGNDSENLYEYRDAIVVLRPKHKICFLNFCAEQEDEFCDFYEDFIEDLGHLSEKYDYRTHLGRPRAWKNKLTIQMDAQDIKSVEELFVKGKLEDLKEQRNADFLISLLVGSINDIARIGGEYPGTILDQVKKKIILFDGDQSRFIYSQSTSQKRVTIQGLAGTGKTELLLHKLKDLYVRDKNSKIVFTCFNKILAQSMKKRVPEFFNFMRVEEQIKWEERLWVMSSWGSKGLPNTGIYSYICTEYNLEFHSYYQCSRFETVCQRAINELNNKENIEPCFDYIFIDESQDFTPAFFELCEMVTRNVVYIAGDIFQDIYDRAIDQSVKSDYLLNKCYRTDSKTLMFAHGVGMGLYEKPVIRWLDDNEWQACGYRIDREKSKFILSRPPLRRFEDLDMTDIQSVEVESSNVDEFAENIFEIIDSIRSKHHTVQPGDIAIVFLEGSNKANYELADYLEVAIPEKYCWNAIKGYETKNCVNDAIFISNRNNIKGLEFPFVICIVRGKISDDVFQRNTIYMMMTRSFITSYLLINEDNKEFISIYKKAAAVINENGIMELREPEELEKKLQNQKVSIAVAKKQRPIKEIIEDVFVEYPNLTQKIKSRVKESMLEFIGEEGTMTEIEIQDRTRKMISAYI